MVGSDYYTAPEVFRHKGYDYKADVFGVGIVTFTLYLSEAEASLVDSVAIIRIVGLLESAFAKKGFCWKTRTGLIFRPPRRIL